MGRSAPGCNSASPPCQRATRKRGGAVASYSPDSGVRAHRAGSEAPYPRSAPGARVFFNFTLAGATPSSARRARASPGTARLGPRGPGRPLCARSRPGAPAARLQAGARRGLHYPPPTGRRAASGPGRRAGGQSAAPPRPLPPGSPAPARTQRPRQRRQTPGARNEQRAGRPRPGPRLCAPRPGRAPRAGRAPAPAARAPARAPRGRRLLPPAAPAVSAATRHCPQRAAGPRGAHMAGRR